MGASIGLVRGAREAAATTAARLPGSERMIADKRAVSSFGPIVSSRRSHCLQPPGRVEGAKWPRGGAKDRAQPAPANARGGPFLAIFWRHYGDNGLYRGRCRLFLVNGG